MLERKLLGAEQECALNRGALAQGIRDEVQRAVVAEVCGRRIDS